MDSIQIESGIGDPICYDEHIKSSFPTRKGGGYCDQTLYCRQNIPVWGQYQPHYTIRNQAALTGGSNSPITSNVNQLRI